MWHRRGIILVLLLGLSWHAPVDAARTFADGQSLVVASALVSGTPLTLCAWVYAPNANLTMGVANVGVSSSDDNGFTIQVQSTNEIQARARATSPGFPATSSTALSATAWTHLCGVFASSTSRSIYVNGGGKVTDSNSVTPTGMNQATFARDYNASTNREWNGPLAYGGLWNAALTDAEVAALAAGIPPQRVRPDALVACPPILGDASPEPDYCAARTWTVVGASSQSAHNPPVIPFAMSRGGQ